MKNLARELTVVKFHVEAERQTDPLLWQKAYTELPAIGRRSANAFADAANTYYTVMDVNSNVWPQLKIKRNTT